MKKWKRRLLYTMTVALSILFVLSMSGNVYAASSSTSNSASCNTLIFGNSTCNSAVNFYQACKATGTNCPTLTCSQKSNLELFSKALCNKGFDLNGIYNALCAQNGNSQCVSGSSCPAASTKPSASNSCSSPSATVKPTTSPKPTASSKPTATPKPTATTKPTTSPKPTASSKPTVSPKPTATATPKPSATTTSQSGVASLEKKMVDLVNAERAKVGLKALTVDSKLTNMARVKSQDMITNSYFSHYSPKYGSPFDMMKTFGISYRTAGENIAMNQSMESAHTALMNSEGHRANILGSGYTKIGIGIVKDSRGYLYITQDFIG